MRFADKGKERLKQRNKGDEGNWKEGREYHINVSVEEEI